MIGRAMGLTLAILVTIGGLALMLNAVAVAGRFSAPMWVVMLVWAGSGLLGIVIGTVGTMMTFKWIETTRRRRAHNAAR